MVGEFGLITISFLVRKNNSMTNIIKTSDVHGNCTRNTLMQLMKFTTFNTFKVFGWLLNEYSRIYWFNLLWQKVNSLCVCNMSLMDVQCKKS